MDACHVDQFEQHVRAIAGLPLGDTSPIAEGGAMANLLGDCWETGEPDWAAALSAGDSRIRLHLYGKAEARAGRKMGHLNMAGPTDTAVAAVRAARERLR
jgi:5-(carboxyamino)imidazole ribonucleotide synthase